MATVMKIDPVTRIEGHLSVKIEIDIVNGVQQVTNAAGVVRWGFEYSVSKGHGRTAGFPATTTVYVNFNVPANSLGTHFIAEVATANAIPSTNIEPDSVIHMRVFRDAANAADTYAGAVWCWQADLHYQAQQYATPNKAPNFYA